MLPFICVIFITVLAGVEAQDCISEHNKYRAAHGVPFLQYDKKLEQFAIMRAADLARTDRFAHPKNLPFGENLYWKSGKIPSCRNALNMWYKEIGLYSYSNPRFSSKTGHFTQMVWKDTQRVGCASSKSKKTGRIYIVCNYYPPGNVIGKFNENVQLPDYDYL